MKKRIFILVLMIFVYLFSYHYFINQSKQVYVAEKEIVVTNEIDNNDILKGLTKKTFGLDYYSCKKELYGILDNLKKQIEEKIF